MTDDAPKVAIRPTGPVKRLYIIGGPVHALQVAFRSRGYQSTAPGIHIFAGEDVIDVSNYESGEHVKWAAYGQISVEMLDNMEAQFGPRTPFADALKWFGATL